MTIGEWYWTGDNMEMRFCKVLEFTENDYDVWLSEVIIRTTFAKFSKFKTPQKFFKAPLAKDVELRAAILIAFGDR